MKKLDLAAAIVSLTCIISSGSARPPAKTIDWHREVVYQIFPNSFCDSNGDRVGDFRGIESKLSYLKGLGVTTLMLNPIFKSRFYHRYFADDFFQVDPVYGTNGQFFHLVRAAHRKGLKILLDMEVQYVADQHPWYLAAKRDPAGTEARFLWKSPGIYTQGPIPTWDGRQISASAIDPDNPEIVDQLTKVFEFWAAPKGNPTAGVDGFRVDHMMDDFDWLHVKQGMLTKMWRPIIERVRAAHPGAFFVGEQADWGLGSDLCDKADVNASFAFKIRTALATLDAEKIRRAIQEVVSACPHGKTQFEFIENHDTERFASLVNSDSAALRLGAMLLLTLKGTPSIYQGQELGMKGIQLKGQTDANDIPVRLAFRWNATRRAKGTATWYGLDGPFASAVFSSDHDGISVEEESKKPGSLLNFYRKWIAKRRTSEALVDGELSLVPTDCRTVVAYQRKAPGKSGLLILLNFADHPVSVNVQHAVRSVRLKLGAFGATVRSW